MVANNWHYFATIFLFFVTVCVCSSSNKGLLEDSLSLKNRLYNRHFSGAEAPSITRFFHTEMLSRAILGFDDYLRSYLNVVVPRDLEAYAAGKQAGDRLLLHSAAGKMSFI